jgi:(R,R)-butanediol dehydrogenase/meso-butanediol dehydrogenase/diacetyl reductase
MAPSWEGDVRAAVWHGRRDLRVEDVPAPTPEDVGADEVLVEVAFCGICGTDLHEYTDGPLLVATKPHPLTGVQAPVTLGHRVAVNPQMFCFECVPCRRGDLQMCDRLAATGASARWGGYSRFVVVWEYQLLPLPDHVSFEEGAVAEPAATAVRAVALGRVTPGDTVFVVGGGPIGQLVAMVARAAGAREVYLSEPSPARRELAARNAEPTRVIDAVQERAAEVVRSATSGVGADVSLECSASERGLHNAIAATRKGGTVVQVAVFVSTVTLDPAILTMRELTLVGCWTYSPADMRRSIELMASGQLAARRIVSGVIDLAEIVPSGFEALTRPDTTHAKILVRPS